MLLAPRIVVTTAMARRTTPTITIIINTEYACERISSEGIPANAHPTTSLPFIIGMYAAK